MVTALGKTMFTFDVDVNAPDVYGAVPLLVTAEGVTATFHAVEAPALPVASVNVATAGAVAPTEP